MLLLSIHVLGGAVGILSGAVALFVKKGGKLHRRGGMIFVWAMLIMSTAGAIVAAIDHQNFEGRQIPPQWSSVLAASLTFYLVATGLLALRRYSEKYRALNGCATVVGAVVAFFGFRLGFQAMHYHTGELNGQPGAAGFVFGGVAVLSVLGDLRILGGWKIPNPNRVIRHLWRMCFAMFIATFSFFIGQAQVFPKPIRILPLLAAPVLLVLLLMVYWVVRVHWTNRRPNSRARQPAYFEAPD
jgi:hypothetical protein